jgi:hypothetical protein
MRVTPPLSVLTDKKRYHMDRYHHTILMADGRITDNRNDGPVLEYLRWKQMDPGVHVAAAPCVCLSMEPVVSAVFGSRASLIQAIRTSIIPERSDFRFPGGKDRKHTRKNRRGS